MVYRVASDRPAEEPQSRLSNESPRLVVVEDGRDERIDALRGIGILGVLILHSVVAEFYPSPGQALGAHVQTALVLAYRWISGSSVPLLFLLSLILYFRKRSKDPATFLRRIQRLSLLYLSWTGVQTVLFVVVNRALPSFNLTMLITGGPYLVSREGGVPVLYFLFDLLLMVLAAEALWRCSERWGVQKVRMASFGLVGLSVLAFAAVTWARIPVPFWSPLNFLCYVPLAYVIETRDETSVAPRVALPLLVLSLAFDLAAMRMLPDFGVFQLPPYARVSAIFGALAVFALAMNAGFRFFPLQFLGRMSLGLFVVHDYFVLLFRTRLPAIVWPTPLGRLVVNLPTFLGVLAASLAVVFFLNRSRLRWLVV